MQIAAMKPIAVDEKGVSKDVIEKKSKLEKNWLVRKEKAEDMLEKLQWANSTSFAKKIPCCLRPL